ncbi:hypothetical protein SB748_05785 [Rhizobium sp. SIMBA_035]
MLFIVSLSLSGHECRFAAAGGQSSIILAGSLCQWPNGSSRIQRYTNFDVNVNNMQSRICDKAGNNDSGVALSHHEKQQRS